MQEPTSLEADEQERLQGVLDRSLELNALAEHIHGFAEIIRVLRGDHPGRQAIVDRTSEPVCDFGRGHLRGDAGIGGIASLDADI